MSTVVSRSAAAMIFQQLIRGSPLMRVWVARCLLAAGPEKRIGGHRRSATKTVVALRLVLDQIAAAVVASAPRRCHLIFCSQRHHSASSTRPMMVSATVAIGVL